MKPAIFVLIIVLLATAPLIIRWDLGSTISQAERHFSGEP